MEKVSILLAQRDRLQTEFDRLKTDGTGEPKEKSDKVEWATTTGDAFEFCKTVRKLLKDWKFPGAGPVTFSEQKQDIVINGKERSGHGKGIRALSYAAFVVGLLQYCRAKKRPCPGFVVLDSPLVAYREPDSQQQVKEAGVAENFYESLAESKPNQQIIVFENIDPPEKLDGVNVVHFTGDKLGIGRCGFFPVG